MKSFTHPSRVVALAFLALIAMGTVLLMLPASQAQGLRTPWLTALFTAVSAVCVTGLAVVDTGTHWSGFGQGVILVLFQFGGFGIMTAATLLGLMVNQSLRLRTQLLTQAETHTVALGDVRSVAKVVLAVTAFCELGLTAVLAVRLHASYGLTWSEALWSGFFHAVSAFNNAGFSIYPDNLVRFVGMSGSASRWRWR
jgi:trk system potassium uptake protein TrkH